MDLSGKDTQIEPLDIQVKKLNKKFNKSLAGKKHQRRMIGTPMDLTSELKVIKRSRTVSPQTDKHYIYRLRHSWLKIFKIRTKKDNTCTSVKTSTLRRLRYKNHESYAPAWDSSVVKVLINRNNNLSSILGTHKVEGNNSQSCLLTSIHCGIHVCMQINKTIKIKVSHLY